MIKCNGGSVLKKRKTAYIRHKDYPETSDCRASGEKDVKQSPPRDQALYRDKRNKGAFCQMG